MKTLLTFLALLLALTANSATVTLPISGFPNTNVLEASDLFVIAHTNTPAGTRTNKNILYRDLLTLISNAIPTSSTNFYTTNITIQTNTTGGGESLWTNMNGLVSLILGDTNSIKISTNGRQGIIIGDTNRAFSFFGWPANDLTFINVRDGSPGHTVNQIFPVAVVDSTGNGAYEGFYTQSGSNPIFSHSSVAVTNAVVATQLDEVAQKGGGYILLRDVGSTNFVGIQNAAQLSTAIGPNHIRIFSHGGEKLILSTNGGVSFFGSATNYGRFYARSNLFLQNLALTTNRVLYLDAGREVVSATFAPTEVSTIVNLMNASNVLSGLIGPSSLWTNQYDHSTVRLKAGSTNFIGGGTGNIIATNNGFSTIGGGVNNLISNSASFATIPGGTNNSIGASAMDATIGGGERNVIGDSSFFATVAGGLLNTIQRSSAGASILGGNSNTIEQNSPQSVILGSGNTIGSNSLFSAILGGSGNRVYANTPYAFVIGTTATTSNANALTVAFTNTTGVQIDVTNLHLIGDMQILMTNGAALNAVLTSDALGRLTLQSFGGGGGGGSAGSGTFINSSNGSGSNATFYGKLAVNTNVFVITNGMIGIGTNAPSAILHIVGPSNANVVRIGQSSTSVSTNSDLGGATLFATKSPLYVSYEGSDADAVTIDSSSVSAPGIAFRRSRNTLLNITNVANNDQIGYLDFRGFSGDRYWHLAGIQGHIDGLVGNGFSPAASLRFITTVSNGVPTERARFDHDGNLMIGTTSYGANDIRLVVKQQQNMTVGDYAVIAIGATNLNQSYGIRASAGTSISDISLGLYDSGGTTNLFLVKGNGDGYIKGAFGIGDSTPDAPLDIEAPSAFMLVTSTTGTSSSYVEYNNTGGIFRVGRERSTGTGLTGGSSAYAGVVAVQSAHPLQLSTDSTVRMTISSTGKVGIGTNAPAAQLHVTADNADLILQAGTTNKPSLLTLSTNGFLALMSGTIYQSNSLALPTAAQIGNGNVWVGMSNGFLVSLKSNGAVNSMLVIH